MKKIFILLFVLASFAASAQYDSTKQRQAINAYGFDYKNIKTSGSNIIPLDTPRLALTDSGAIAYKGGFIWAWNGRKWTLQAGGVIIDVSDGIDSVTYSSNELCQWVDGESTCYRLNKFFDSSSTQDGKIYYYNNGIVRDSLNISDTSYAKSPIYYDGDTTKFKNDSLPILKYASRDTSNWDDSTLIDKKFFEDRIDAKQDALTLTTTGSSGAATLTGSTLNIPQYSGGGGDSFTTQIYSTGDTVIIADASNWLIIDPDALKDSLTIILPESPVDREEVTVSFGGTITGGNDVVTNLTISANTDQGLIQNFSPTYFQSGEMIRYRYNSSTSKWYAQ